MGIPMKVALTLLSALLAQGVSQTDGTIMGRLVQRDGSPAANTRVMALVVADPSMQVGSSVMSIAQTDAAGFYHLEKVPPGRYYVTAGFVNGPSYFPGVADRSLAKVVTVAAGGSLQGIDFVQVASQKISGRVVLLANSPPLQDGRGTQIRLMDANGLAQFTKIAPDGTFEFSAVQRGGYGAMVNPGVNMIPVQIVVEDKDITGIELAVPATRLLTGQVTIEGEGRVTRMEFAVGSSVVNAFVPLRGDGFRIMLPEGEFPIALSTSSPSGYAVREFTYGSVNLLKAPLKVTQSNTDPLRLVLRPVNTP